MCGGGASDLRPIVWAVNQTQMLITAWICVNHRLGGGSGGERFHDGDQLTDTFLQLEDGTQHKDPHVQDTTLSGPTDDSRGGVCWGLKVHRCTSS